MEKVASFVLDQLQNRISEPQIAIYALGCLSQCILWHITGSLLHERIVNGILSLGKIYLPCQQKMRDYRTISDQFDRKLELIEIAFNLDRGTAKDIEDLKVWLIEIAKG